MRKENRYIIIGESGYGRGLRGRMGEGRAAGAGGGRGRRAQTGCGRRRRIRGRHGAWLTAGGQATIERSEIVACLTIIKMFCRLVIYKADTYRNVEENSSVFALIQMCLLPSENARANPQQTTQNALDFIQICSLLAEL